jgi:hypothetical protein
MAVLSAAQLHQIASDVNTRRVNDHSDFLYDEIVSTAMKGQFSYERTFHEPMRSLIERIIARMKDVFEGITITHDLADYGKVVFCWEIVDDDMPPLIPFDQPFYDLE